MILWDASFCISRETIKLKSQELEKKKFLFFYEINKRTGEWHFKTDNHRQDVCLQQQKIKTLVAVLNRYLIPLGMYVYTTE